MNAGGRNKVLGRVRGFSLIEILISILILSLGLLGLGALFPAVIREQRTASDQVAGVIAVNNLRALLEVQTLRELGVRYEKTVVTSGPNAGTTYAARYYGWAGVLAGPVAATTDPSGGAGLRGFSTGPRLGLWEPGFDWEESPRGLLKPRQDLVAEFGDLIFDRPTVAAGGGIVSGQLDRTEYPGGLPTSVLSASTRYQYPPTDLLATDRLGPDVPVGEASPTLVWDYVLRRVPKGRVDPLTGVARASINDDVQFAVFVRRIDPRIRLEPGQSVRAKLSDPSLAPQDRVVPVGEDASRRPTLDGTGGAGGGPRYALALEAYAPDNALGYQATFQFNASENVEDRQWLENVDVTQTTGDAMAQIGQKLIDNLGNVYTVERIERPANGPSTARRLRVSPAPSLDLISVNAVTNRRAIQQLIFTAQVPVAVFTLDARVPRSLTENVQ